MAVYRTASARLTKLTVRLPVALQTRLKKRAQHMRQSLNTAIVEALTRGLDAIETQAESQYDRTMRVIRESGLYEPLGESWDKYIQAAPDVTVDEVRRIWEGQKPLSEDIIQERRERE